MSCKEKKKKYEHNYAIKLNSMILHLFNLDFGLVYTFCCRFSLHYICFPWGVSLNGISYIFSTADDTQLYPSRCFILQDKGSIIVTANIDYKFVKLTNKLIVEFKPTLETTEVFIDRGEEMPLV